MSISSISARRRFGPAFLVLASLMVMGVAHSQTTNSWSASSGGRWEKVKDWDDGLPSAAQSAVIISNANSKMVAINRHTACKFPRSLILSNLTVSAQRGVTNALCLNNTGTIALHILNGLTVGIDPDDPSGAGGMELISTKSTLMVDGLLGGQLLDNGTMVIMGGSLITTNCSLQLAASFDNTAGLLVVSHAVVQARDISIGLGGSSSGTLEVFGGTMTLSSSLDIGDGAEFSQGNLLVANGALLVVTNGETDIGGGDETDGSMTVSNASFLAAGLFLGGEMGGGELTINDGTVTLSGILLVGGGSQSGFGDVLLNGGRFVVTNDMTLIGEDNDNGILTISAGTFLGQTVLVGTGAYSSGMLSIQGGISVLSSNLEIGSAFSDAAVFITGGQLFVTNAPIVVNSSFDARCLVSGGRLAARTIELVGFAGGTLVVDGGSVTVSKGITLGDCNDDSSVGYASVDGGQLIVANAARTGFIDVRNGELTIDGGTLRVDKLVMTNTCSSLVHTGGTLIVGSVVLDPDAFGVTSVAREGNDLRVTWMMGPGQSNVLQAASTRTHHHYYTTTTDFTDIFVVTNNTTPGVVTNYLDIGAATNFPPRSYRARLLP